MRASTFFTSALLVFIWAISTIQAAPAEDTLHQQYDAGNTSTNDNDLDAPVKYHGAQLWRIPFDRLQERNAVADLQNRFGELW